MNYTGEVLTLDFSTTLSFVAAASTPYSPILVLPEEALGEDGVLFPTFVVEKFGLEDDTKGVAAG